MDSLYLLLPMSVLLVLALIGLFAWALSAGQFDDLEREGTRVLDDGVGSPAAPVRRAANAASAAPAAPKGAAGSAAPAAAAASAGSAAPASPRTANDSARTPRA